MISRGLKVGGLMATLFGAVVGGYLFLRNPVNKEVSDKCWYTDCGRGSVDSSQVTLPEIVVSSKPCLLQERNPQTQETNQEILVKTPKQLEDFLYIDKETKEPRFAGEFFDDPDGIIRWLSYNYELWRNKDVSQISCENEKTKEITFSFGGLKVVERQNFLKEGYVPQHEINILYKSNLDGKMNELLLDAKGAKETHGAFSGFSRVYLNGEEQQRLFNTRNYTNDRLYLNVGFEIGKQNPDNRWIFGYAGKEAGLISAQWLSYFMAVSSSFKDYFDELKKGK